MVQLPTWRSLALEGCTLEYDRPSFVIIGLPIGSYDVPDKYRDDDVVGGIYIENNKYNFVLYKGDYEELLYARPMKMTGVD